MAALLKVGLALVVVVAATAAEDKCRTGCHGVTPNVFKFVEGSTYKYDYEGNVDISLSSAEGQSSTTKVKATVLLTQQGQCNQVLRVQNLQVVGGDSKKYTNIADIEKPIQLNFHDGHVEDFICTEPSDTQNSLNIKRALASMFQAAVKHHGTEIDVFGSCPTEFSTRKDGQTQVIKKTRNLNKCSYRESLKQNFMRSGFDRYSQVKSSPFLQGKFEAELKLTAGIPQLITVDEDYLYVPFSNGGKGAKANVHSQLKYLGVSKESPQVSCSIPRSIIFEDPHPITSDKGGVGIILKSIKEASNNIGSNVKENSASKFSSIIKLMKGATKKDLALVYGQVRAGAGFLNKDFAKRVFLDALFRARTGEAVEVAMDIYRSNGFNDLESKLFFVSLNLIQHPTEASLTAAANLLSQPNVPREAYLGVGVLAKVYCQQHACDKVKGLNALLTAFQSKLSSRPANREAENVVMAALKGIANTGQVTNQLVGKIIEIAQDKQAPTRLRVAALETYLADACNDRFRESGINILKDIQQDSEIRIKAYLAIAECPNGKIVSVIKNLIDNEPSVQVGGFIVSHLATVRSSSNLDKQHVKAQLLDVKSTKKYPWDFRQYSFNTELSYDIHSLGVGESLEANVIYSQKSFLPRSTSLNLTSEIFGHRYNFLEVETRQENLDALLAAYVGPKGLLRANSPQSLFQAGSTRLQELVNKLSERLKQSTRAKREVNKNQIENFAKQITDRQNALNKDLDLDLSVKLFGSELLFLSLSEDIQKYTPEAFIDKVFDVLDDAKENAKDFDKTLTSNLIFLDGEVSYPTSIGFPLRLDLEGAATVQLKTSGKIDFVNLWDKTGDFKFTLIPSVSVQVSGRLVVDAAVVESGLNVVGNLYSSVGSSVELSLNRRKLDYKLTLPVDKQELVTVTHNIVFETRELCGPETITPVKFVQSKDFSVCLDQLEPYVGLIVCANLNQPNIGESSTNILPYPLNGNSKLSLTILKKDFGYLLIRDEELSAGGHGIIEVVDVHGKPKSNFQYEVVASPDPTILLQFTSSEFTAKFETRLVYSKTDFYGLVRFATNQLEYYVKLGVTYSGSDTRIVYKPIMEYKAGHATPQQLPYHVTGQIILEQTNQQGGKKYIFDNVQLVSSDFPPIGITGAVTVQSGEISGDLTLDDGKKKATLKGKAHLNEKGINLNMQFLNNYNPNTNFDLKYTLKVSDLLNVDSNLQLIHGPDISDKNALLKLCNSIEYHSQGGDPSFGTEHELSYPGLGLDNKLKVKTTRKSLDFAIKVGYNNVKVGTELELEVDKKTKGDLDFELEIFGFDNKLAIDLRREVQGYKSRVHGKFAVNGNSLDIKGDVKHLMEQQRGDIGHDLVIKITSLQDIKWKSELKYSQNDIDTFVKVNCGQDLIVDAFLKANKAGNVNGNVKVNIPHRLIANGQVKANKGAGTANLILNLPDIQRKFKSDASFTITEPVLKLDLTLFTNFDKDNSRKYRFLTINHIKPESSLDSKNTLEILGEKSELNFKLNRAGDINDFDQSVEGELILPNEQYFATKLSRKGTNNKGIMDGQGYLSLEQRPNKNASGRTITLKGVGKGVDLNKGVFDLSYNLGMDNGAGETLNGELALKNSKDHDWKNYDFKGKLYGSVLPESLEGAIIGKCKEGSADYRITGSYGKGATINIKGNHDFKDAESPDKNTAELSVDVLTPNSPIKVVKYHVKASASLPQTDEANFKCDISTSLFVDGSQPGSKIDYKYEGTFDAGPKYGHSTDRVSVGGQEVLVFLYNYKRLSDTKYQGDLSLKFAKDKEVKMNLDFETPKKNVYDIDFQLETPIQSAQKVRLQSHIVDGDNAYQTESTLTVNDLKYVGKLSLDLDDSHPSYNVELVYPTGKVDKLYAKLLRYNNNGLAAESKVLLHVYDFSLDTNVDISFHDIEDFTIKFYVDSPKLALQKISMTANTKEVHGSKKLLVNAKEGGKNFIDGTTTYRIRKEEGKIIVDGSGSLTIRGEKKSGNFKVLYRELNQRRDKETGIQLTINSIIGSRAFDIEYILTEDHFKYLTSYCVEKQECAHIEVESKIQKDLHEIVQINLDLRPLGVSHEFGLKSETLPKQLKYVLDVHLVSNQFKYQYNVLVLPTESHFTLTTPKRVVSLETQINSPKKGEPLKGHAVLYLNKKAKPQEKSLLEFQVNLANEHDAICNFKFTAPPLKKPLVVSYKHVDSGDSGHDIEVIVDVLPNTDKRIVVSSRVSIAHKGKTMTTSKKSLLDLQLLNYKATEEVLIIQNYEDYVSHVEYTLKSIYQNKPIVTSYLSKYSRDGAQSKLVLYNKVIYDVNAKTKFSKEQTVVDTDYKFIGAEPRTSHLEIKDGNTLKFVIYKTGKPNNKLQINSGLIPGSIADFRMDVHEENKKIDLIHGSVKLDEADFGKSNYGIDSNNINKYLISPVQQISQNIVKDSTDALTEAVNLAKHDLKTLGDAAQANKPDYRPLFHYYEAEAKALREEIITDKSLKLLADTLDGLVSAVVTVILDVIDAVRNVTEKIIGEFHQQTLNFAEMIEKDILPKVKEIIAAITQKTVSIFESFTDLCFGILGQVSSFLDAHQKELKQVATVLSQITKDIVRFLRKANDQLTELFKTEVHRISEEMKALPVAADLEKYIKSVSIGKPMTDELITEFKQHIEELKIRIPYPKVVEFIDLAAVYLEKKMRETPCDDQKEISAIVKAGIEAIDEVVNHLLSLDFDTTIFNIPLPSKALNTLPDYLVISSSLISRLSHLENIPTWEQFSTFATLNPKQMTIPQRRYAIVAQGQHIFTFDGKHLTFPGKCSYLLSRDVVNDEFSIVGVYVNGGLSELTFVDKTDTITLKKSGGVTFNGAATEFPVRGKNTDAFRTYDQVHLKSNAGVTIYCEPDLSLCLFGVSGFYHSHLRGLLGNANGEPYDDYTLPKGNIVTSESDFGNSYKIQGNCPAVKTVDHHTHHRAESCTKLFTDISELAPCYPFVNTKNFRQACDHGVAAKVPDTEAAIAKAYVMACASRYIPVFVPSQYVKCENSDKAYDLYDTFSVKLPQKAADIVFAIEAGKENAETYKDLVQNLGSTLIKDLAEKGIKDVEYHVLTYGGEHPEWPSHVTTNGGKMTFKGRMPNVKFGESPSEDEVDLKHEGANFALSLLLNYIQEIRLALGFEPQSLAYLEAIQYPFRANALKAIVAVSSTPCQKSEFHWIQRLRALLVRQPTIHLNLITPLGKDCDFKVKDEKTTKNVIGFNNKAVFTYTDAKKKPSGNSELLKDLSYDDFCSEYTALAGGNVFVLDNFNKNKGKIFTSVTSHNIADSLMQSEQGLDCACVRSGLTAAKNKCISIYSKDNPHAGKKVQKG